MNVDLPAASATNNHALDAPHDQDPTGLSALSLKKP